MMFSKVFVVRCNNYSGVMAQGLEGDCIELRSHGVCSRADWASKLERETEASCACLLGWKGCLSAYLQDLGSQINSTPGERVDRTKLYILIECMGTE